MRQVIATTTAILIGIHAMLGCCWHHAHAAVPDHGLAEHNHDDHSPVDHDHDHESEGNEDCVFVKGEATASQQMTQSLLASTGLMHLDATLLPVAVSFRATPSVLDPGGVRTHLLHSMLRC